MGKHSKKNKGGAKLE
jgi:hypothetical protein